MNLVISLSQTFSPLSPFSKIRVGPPPTPCLFLQQPLSLTSVTRTHWSIWNPSRSQWQFCILSYHLKSHAPPLNWTVALVHITTSLGSHKSSISSSFFSRVGLFPSPWQFQFSNYLHEVLSGTVLCTELILILRNEIVNIFIPWISSPELTSFISRALWLQCREKGHYQSWQKHLWPKFIKYTQESKMLSYPEQCILHASPLQRTEGTESLQTESREALITPFSPLPTLLYTSDIYLF